MSTTKFSKLFEAQLILIFNVNVLEKLILEITMVVAQSDESPTADLKGVGSNPFGSHRYSYQLQIWSCKEARAPSTEFKVLY